MLGGLFGWRRPGGDFRVERDVSLVRGGGDEQLEVVLLVDVLPGGRAVLGVEGEVGVGVEVLALLEVVKGIAAELALAVGEEEEIGGAVKVDNAALGESADAATETLEKDVDVVSGEVEVFGVGEAVVEGDD